MILASRASIAMTTLMTVPLIPVAMEVTVSITIMAKDIDATVRMVILVKSVNLKKTSASPIHV